MAQHDPDADISAEHRQMVEDFVNGNTPMEKWDRHTGVSTFDDLYHWAEQQLREVLSMRMRRAERNGGPSPEDDLEDYLIGKQAVLNPLLANMRQIIERSNAPHDGKTNPADSG